MKFNALILISLACDGFMVSANTRIDKYYEDCGKSLRRRLQKIQENTGEALLAQSSWRPKRDYQAAMDLYMGTDSTSSSGWFWDWPEAITSRSLATLSTLFHYCQTSSSTHRLSSTMEHHLLEVMKYTSTANEKTKNQQRASTTLVKTVYSLLAQAGIFGHGLREKSVQACSLRYSSN